MGLGEGRMEGRVDSKRGEKWMEWFGFRVYRLEKVIKQSVKQGRWTLYWSRKHMSVGSLAIQQTCSLCTNL